MIICILFFEMNLATGMIFIVMVLRLCLYAAWQHKRPCG